MQAFLTIINLLKYLSILLPSVIGFKKYKDKLKEHRIKGNKQKFVAAHEAIASVYPVMLDVLNKYQQIDRVVIRRSHNGDGIPVPGKQSFTTCVQEVVSYKTSPILEMWQSIPADLEMVNILSELIVSDNHQIQMTDEGTSTSSEPGGIMTDYCAGNGIKCILSVPVLHLDSGFLFLSFCSTSTDDLKEIDGILFDAYSTASRISKIFQSQVP